MQGMFENFGGYRAQNIDHFVMRSSWQPACLPRPAPESFLRHRAATLPHVAADCPIAVALTGADGSCICDKRHFALKDLNKLDV